MVSKVDLYLSGSEGLGTCVSSYISKDQLERELDRARAPLLIEGACPTEALVQHFGGLSKQQIAQIRIDVPEVRVIQDVECFSSKLHVPTIIEVEVSPDGDVRLHSAKTAQKIPRSIPLHHAVRQTESRRDSIGPSIGHAALRVRNPKSHFTYWPKIT